MAAGTKLRDVEHLLRVVVLVVVGVVAFLAVRAWLVPADFGVYGHFRAGALDDARARTPVHAGHEACAECHDEVVAARAGSRHERIACEACHGALGLHAADPTGTVPERPEPQDLCLRCHRHSNYRPSDFPQVEPEEHAGDEPCKTCHEPHHPGIS